MTTTEELIARHYSHGSLGETILAGLEQMQAHSDAPPVDLLASVDEFHMGGRAATIEIVEKIGLSASNHMLDVGCGLGGTARYCHSASGCRVTGVDLTDEYVRVGNQLNAMLGLSSAIDLVHASAMNMPCLEAHFDRATLLHVGMNIDDKQALMAEIHRVLKPDSLFMVYDVMRLTDDPIRYPVAWANDDTTSFVSPVQDYTHSLQSAGFEIVDVTEKAALALQFFDKILSRIAEGGVPPLGLHIVMGADAKTKLDNMRTNVKNGVIAPVQLLARRL